MNIYLILSLIFSTILSYFTIKNFSQSKFTLKSLIIYFVIMLPLFLLINLYFNGILKIILILALTSISLYFSLFNKRILECFYYSFIYEFFVFIVELVLSIIWVSIFNFNLESYNSFSLSILIFSALNSIIILLISKIKFIDNLLLKYYQKLIKKRYLIIYLFLLLTLIASLLSLIR